MTTPATVKAHENRLRRKAELQGFRLEKSRRRDIHAPDFNRFALINVKTGLRVGAARDKSIDRFPFDLDAVEALLTKGRWKQVQIR